MKVIKSTRSLIHLINFPLGIGIFGWSMSLVLLSRLFYLIWINEFQPEDLFLIVGILISYFGGSSFAKKEIWIFNKDENSIYWSRKSLFGASRGTIPIDDVIKISLQSTSGNNKRLYRVAVETKNEIIPITQAYSLGKENEYRELHEKIEKLIFQR